MTYALSLIVTLWTLVERDRPLDRHAALRDFDRDGRVVLGEHLALDRRAVEEFDRRGRGGSRKQDQQQGCEQR